MEFQQFVRFGTSSQEMIRAIRISTAAKASNSISSAIGSLSSSVWLRLFFRFLLFLLALLQRLHSEDSIIASTFFGSIRLNNALNLVISRIS
ncbi:hypothetical protein O9993_14220 [Vibrio lentus]|nr:hypothetical protein [Vibrio lentus]